MKHSKKCPQYHVIGYVRLKNSSITRDLRIGRLCTNRISNRIGRYDSNSNRISNRIGRNYIPPKASSTLATMVGENGDYSRPKRRQYLSLFILQMKQKRCAELQNYRLFIPILEHIK